MSGMEIVPQDIDKLVADWSVKTGTGMTDAQFGTLVAHIYNGLLSDGNIHTVPNNGLHFESRHCFCAPAFGNPDRQPGDKIHFVHNDHKTETTGH